MSPTDEELMQQLAQGDMQALGELAARHRQPLTRYLYRLTENRTTAEDLVQDTFLRLWQYRAAFDGSRKLTAWLFCIASHLVYNQTKSGDHHTDRFSQLSEEEMADVEAVEAESPLAHPERLAVQVEVRKALQRLPVEQRMCLVLREYDQLSYEEIGQIVGCSAGNARVLACRGRQRMQTLLGPLIEGGM
jgi:RNA polymerase sigma-70 factor (ECF subfamily)